MEICIDFDGTCVTHEFPKIGKDIGALPVLRKIVDAGHRIILFTMRSDIEEVTSNDYGIHKQPGKYLTEALEWFTDNDIPLYGINTNPEQFRWTKSPKAYANLYIDDAALGCPLIHNPEISDRAYVDWVKVEEMLKSNGYLKREVAVSRIKFIDLPEEEPIWENVEPLIDKFEKLIEEQNKTLEKEKGSIDWEQRRYEVARELYVHYSNYPQEKVIEIADKFINKLKNTPMPLKKEEK